MIPAGLVSVIQAAQHIVVLTGSGVSAESGVPTFRDAQSGLWASFDPRELATPEAFERDPALVWRWYQWRRDLVAKAEPNAGHHALSILSRLPRAFTLITQNVDGLHQRAGSEDVIEFHGNLFADRCINEDLPVDSVYRRTDVPVCGRCGGPVRPGVVWFGEPIPPQALQAADTAIENCDVFLSVGTSSMVWPAAGLADSARAKGATVIEINPDVTPQSTRSHYCLQGKSGEVLPELINSLAL